MIDILLLVLLIAVAIYSYRQRPLPSYFFSIHFEWADIYALLDLSKKDVEHLKINPDYHYVSHNGNDGEGLGIDHRSAIFEYFISPNHIGNANLRYSSIYDQQLHRFFETPNTWYSDILWDGNLNAIGVKFGASIFQHNGVSLSGLMIVSSSEDMQKILLIAFDEKYLNSKNAHCKWGDSIPSRVLRMDINQNDRSGNGHTAVTEVTTNKSKIHINITPQSQEDAQSFHIPSEMYSFLKKSATENSYLNS